MNLKCPHCLENFNANTEYASLFNAANDPDRNQYAIESLTCTNSRCLGRIIFLVTTHIPDNTGMPAGMISMPSPHRRMIFPKTMARANVIRTDIPETYLSDYDESCTVLADSPKASAALSRRVLQAIIHGELGIDKGNLSKEIDAVIEGNELPSRINELLDGVRVIGNFAAHPEKSKSTGSILDVEPGEAETNIDVLEELFDYLFTAKRLSQERLDRINAKLAEAGKQPLRDRDAEDTSTETTA